MKIFIISLRFMGLMIVLTGFIYPAFITIVSQIVFPFQANGSVIFNSSGQAIGSELIAQNFKTEKYFWPRPSAIDFNPMSSGGSNQGPISQSLRTQVQEREKQGLTHEMQFTSGSGLDPHISPEAAQDQVMRIAKARNINQEAIQNILNEHMEFRQFGFLGQTRINVLKLNLALDERFR